MGFRLWQPKGNIYDDGTTSFSKDNADDYAIFTYDGKDNKYYWVKKDGSRIKVR